MKKHLILTIILLSPLLWAQTPVVTPSTPSVNPTVTTDIEFLLDASGSMNAMADGESQITIAKRSLKETIATIPAGTSVAFRAYSHRIPQADKVASCQDTELLIPFQPLNTMNFSASVDAIQAKGWTPIAYSLKAAGTDFQSRESQHVIILLSDGEETCGGDPVAEAKSLLAQGFKLTIHTIGFRVDEKTKAQLAAISNATGGMYFDAKDAASLATNLKQATQKALLIDKPAEETRGHEIRGGNQYTDAVLLQSGVEYHLDHHLKKDQYDYFYVEAGSNQTITASLTTTDHGIRVNPDNQVIENNSPYAGLRLVGPDFQELRSNTLIGKRHGKIELSTMSSSAGRYYIVIGNKYDPQHKDHPFRVDIKTFSDAGSGSDAGADILHALPIEAKEYPENWIVTTGTSSGDHDFYQLNVKANESYSIVISPNGMGLIARLRVYDQDRVQKLAQETPNAGAVLRTKPITPGYDGLIYLDVHSDYFSASSGQPQGYSFGITVTPSSASEVAPANTPPSAPSPAVPQIPGMQSPPAGANPADAAQAFGQVAQQMQQMQNQFNQKLQENVNKPASEEASPQKSGSSKIVFYVIGGVAIIATILGLLVFVLLRKKPQ